MSSANYDVASGLDQATLNGLAQSVYTAVYPSFFTGSKPVGQFSVKQVDWDITQAPQFDLSPSSRALEIIRGSLQSMADSGLRGQLLQYLADSPPVTFELSTPAFTITIETDDGKKIRRSRLASRCTARRTSATRASSS